MEEFVSAEQVIELIKSLEPMEIERLFVLIKEYEMEVRRRQASTRLIPMDAKFEEAVDGVFTQNRELFQKLAEHEANERKSATT